MARPRIPALGRPIVTPRFELRPIGMWEMARRQTRLLQDDEIRGLLTHRKKRPTLLSYLRSARRNNGRTRFYHAIVDRQTGAFIGTHTIRIIPWRTASLAVVIDKPFWGTGVVNEVRRALIIVLARDCGMMQIASRVHSRNFASMLNYAKMGFENEGTLNMCEFDEIRGEPADYILFSLRGEELAKAVAAWSEEGVLVS